MTSKFKAEMNKRLGEGTFFTFEGNETVKVQPVSTGIPSLDFSLGIGGWPWGRIIELFGPESSGKTTVALQTISQYQKLSKNPDHPFHEKPEVAFIDAEHALDALHVDRLKVDVTEETGMLINQPDYGEQAFDTVETLISSGRVGLIVVDSVAALVPKKELDGTNEDNQVGLQARMISKGLRKITSIAYKNSVTIIFINQLREKVGQMYGNPETTPGGRALKFFSSVRAEVRKKPIQKSNATIGQVISINIKKNKVARPFTKAEVDYYFDTLFDTLKDIMNVAIEQKVINRGGAYYFLGDSVKEPATDGNGNELKWQGKDNLLETLRVSPALFAYINDLVQGNIPTDAQFVEEDYDDEEYTEDMEDNSKEETLV